MLTCTPRMNMPAACRNTHTRWQPHTHTVTPTQTRWHLHTRCDTHPHIHSPTKTPTPTHKHAHIHARPQTHTHTHTQTHTQIFKEMQINTYMYNTCTHTSKYSHSKIHACTHMHTNTHTTLTTVTPTHWDGHAHTTQPFSISKLLLLNWSLSEAPCKWQHCHICVCKLDEQIKYMNLNQHVVFAMPCYFWSVMASVQFISTLIKCSPVRSHTCFLVLLIKCAWIHFEFQSVDCTISTNHVKHRNTLLL